ncbi:hypothetical protein CPLU01_15936 [Colletotrichum plurivorum]|uniref:Uncharacterized protein n=1 Tax=Colletotrichum plurivorum TaxID=2175906 RepID=A0A8H6J3T8_9PEZI|nr:hypothetical protein CPLU01_15936 [Colletotrichum plurivorum]
MEVTRSATTVRPENLTARLVAVIIHEMTTCISCWREYAASKDMRLQQLHRDNQKHQARIEDQNRTIEAQAEHIRRLEFDISPVGLSYGTVSPAALCISLQDFKTSDSVLDAQSSFAGEALENSLQETYGQSPDGDDPDIADDAFAPLMALAVTAAEDIAGQDPDAGEVARTEVQSPVKRHIEEAETASKRGRHM